MIQKTKKNMKIKTYSILFIMLAYCFPLNAAEESTTTKNFQLSIWAPKQIQDSSTSICGVRLSLFYGINEDVCGLDFALLGVNRTNGEFKGFQYALGGNCTQGDVTGAQWSLVNTGNNVAGWQDGLVNMANGNFVGLQGGGVNITKGDFKGWQHGLLANITKGNFVGLQSNWICNIVKGDTTGVQFALFYNASAEMKGLQLGLVNIAEDLNGVQLGLVNIINSRNNPPFYFLPLLNVSF